MQNSDYLISENPMKALVFFSLPMIIGNLFQQAYTMADSAIVGRLVGGWGGLFTDEYFYLHCYWWRNWCLSHCQPVFRTGQLWKIEKSSLYGTDFLSAHQRTARRIRTVVQQKDYDCPKHSG